MVSLKNEGVQDTNVIISVLNFPGNEKWGLKLAPRGRFEFYLSRFILEEVAIGSGLPSVRAAHMELIPLRPLNYLDVPGGVIHCLALLHSEYPSLMCRRTSECTGGSFPSGLLVGKRSHPYG